jgi:glucosamine-6-phosphate deaminase
MQSVTVPQPVKELQVDQLCVRIYQTRQEMGMASGMAVAATMRRMLAERDTIRMVFAAAPSQNEFLATLTKQADLYWQRVIAFHLDEYIGLDPKAPQGFGNWLRAHIFDSVHPQVVHYLRGDVANSDEECRRYGTLLHEAQQDIACIGIGENGHIAFNDPPVADFNDARLVKVVKLDEICRQQQVNDGCFASIEQVPTHALTLTMPACVSAREIHCMVPGSTKAHAVRNTLYGPIAESCPASILRRTPGVILYLDVDSAALI